MATHYITGSGESPAVCFVEGNEANRVYGVPVYHNEGPCPNCRTPIDVILSFNPTDSYYYLAPCPSCGKFIRYLDNNGNISDLKIVSSKKRTPLDEEEDFPLHTGTF